MLYSSPLLQPLLQLAKSNPDFVVLYHQHKVVTARELMQKSINVAALLREKGFKENDIAVIAVQPGEEFMEIMYAIIMLHGKIAIIDPEMGKENYAAKMNQLNPQWMFIDSRLLFLQEHPILKWILLKTLNKFPDITLIAGTVLVSVGKTFPIFRKHISFNKLQNFIGKPPTKDPSIYPVLQKVSELHNIEEARHILFTKMFLQKYTSKAGFIKRCIYSYVILMNIYFMRSLYVKKEIFERIGCSNSGELYKKAFRNYKKKFGAYCLDDIKAFVKDINGFNWATRWAWKTFLKTKV